MVQRLMNRMRFATRLFVTGSILLAALLVCVVMLAKAVHRQIEATAGEQAGLQYHRALRVLLQDLQKHRGATVVVRSGHAGFRDAQQGYARAIDAQFAVVESAQASPGFAMSSSGQLARIRSSWQELRKKVDTMTAEDGFLAHGALIASLLGLMDQVARESELVLDWQPDAYFLVDAMLGALPVLVEQLGQMRAAGLVALSQGEPGRSDVRRLLMSSGFARGTFDRMEGTLAQAGRHSDRVRASLEGSIAKSKSSVQTMIDLVNNDILSAGKTSVEPQKYFTLATNAIDTTFELYDRAAAVLNDTLTARVVELKAQLLWAFCAVALFVVSVIFLAWRIARDMTQRLAVARSAAERIAAGDLAYDAAAAAGADEAADLVRSMGDMRRFLQGATSEVRAVAAAINQSSVSIGESSDDLSRRTEEQAASLQETATSLAHLADTVGSNAATALKVSSLATDAAAKADHGGTIIQDVVERMNLISAASHRVAEIVSVIDGIAFQTNILALNAAVEAARAGEQGRGFAVVAAEVRSLAQRSAAAAREVKELIGDSVQKVESGTRLVDEAGGVIHEIVAAVRKVNEHIAEISTASQEQSGGIAEVNAATGELAKVTQENAQVVQLTNSFAQELRAQADRLSTVVSRFRLPVEAVGGKDVAHRPGAPVHVAAEEIGSTWDGAERRGPDRATNVSRLPRPSHAAGGPVPASVTPSKAQGRAVGDDWESF